jgi:hypothetical protein
MFWQKSIACSIVMSMPVFHTSSFAAVAVGAAAAAVV